MVSRPATALSIYKLAKMKKKKTNKSKLTPAAIGKFRALLLAKRKEILGTVICIEDETLRKHRSDSSRSPTYLAELGTDNYERELALELMENERELIVEIDEALNRLENGTYGICEGSGKRILKTRLAAIPWTRYCVEYARLLEKGLARKEDSFVESDRNGQMDEEEDSEAAAEND